MKNDSKNRHFVCDYPGCGKVFNRRDYLERHSANHLDIKPFVCVKCNRHFSRKDLYDNHLNTKFHAKRTLETADGVYDDDFDDDEQDYQAVMEASNSAANSAANSAQGPSSHILLPGQISMLPEDILQMPAQAIDSPAMDYDQNDDLQSSKASPEEIQLANMRPRDAYAAKPNSASALDKSSTGFIYAAINPADNDIWEFYRSLKRIAPTTPGSVYQKAKHSRRDRSLSQSQGSLGLNTPESMSRSTSTSLTSSSSHSASVSSSDAPANPSKFAEAQRLWVEDRIKRDTDDEKLPGINFLYEPIREEGKESAGFNHHYKWFFDDKFNTSNEKYGYDRIYREAVTTYTHRSAKYQERYPRMKPASPAPLSAKTAELIVSVLSDIPTGYFDDRSQLDKYMEIAWEKANGVSYVVHRASYDPNRAHPALLAVLVMLGMALSDDENAKEIAKSVYPAVSLYAYESLDQPEGPMSTRYAAPYIGHLQALCLLLRYESLTLGEDTPRLSLIRFNAGRRIADKFLWMAMLSVPHLGRVPEGSSQPWTVKRKPIWATLSSEAYVFHQGAEREVQWKEWAAYESCKRCVHFAVYSESLANLSDSTQNMSQVSIFHLDIHIICPDSIWEAPNAEEFSYIIGPSLIVSNVPYLGFIKSLVRFPRVATKNNARGRTENGGSEPLSTFAIRMIACSLMNIVGRLSGVFARGDSIMQTVLSRSVGDASSDLQVPPFFGQEIQARLYRGLDMWFDYFEEAYGNVTERLFKVADSLGLKITDGFTTLDSDNFDEGIPQYALIVVLYHYSSFIILHEDLPVVLQVTTSLAKWLQGNDTSVHNIKDLMEFLYMPLYTQWVHSDEAKAIVSTASLYLLWVDAATGQVSTRYWNHIFLSAVIYIAVIVIWLVDLTTSQETLLDQTSKPMDLTTYDFIDDALKYLRDVYTRTESHPPMPQSPRSKDSIRSVILLGACVLHVRPHTASVVSMLVQLLCVIDPRITPELVQPVLDGAQAHFEDRKDNQAFASPNTILPPL